MNINTATYKISWYRFGMSASYDGVKTVSLNTFLTEPDYELEEKAIARAKREVARSGCF